ncbi:MAG: hypothetical protein DI538_28050 [Azospira oryzae]|nr:MAG: hypothetical protein DI538_28050 [Azospira oryzae]
MKNPSGGSITMKQPFVKMIYVDKTIASSQVKDVNIKIPKYSEVNLEPIRINLFVRSVTDDQTFMFPQSLASESDGRKSCVFVPTTD